MLSAYLGNLTFDDETSTATTTRAILNVVNMNADRHKPSGILRRNVCREIQEIRSGRRRFIYFSHLQPPFLIISNCALDNVRNEKFT